MNWEREFLGVALILASGMVVIVGVELWARHTCPSAEVARKLLHVAGIVPCLFIPWLIHSTLVAVVLALALAAGLWAGARFGLLRSVSGVARRSHGEAFYPIALLGIFVLSGDRTWMFFSALLAFGVADAVAALVGSACGRLRYEIGDEEKSMEGSLVFFAITFTVVALPLLLMAGLPWANCLLAALLTASLVTGFEAISLRGFDNLTVPLGVCIVLDRIVDLSWQDLLTRNLILFGLLLGIGTVARMTKQISPGATIVFVLFIYLASEFVDWRWALAPATGFVLYAAVLLAVPTTRGCRTGPQVVALVQALLPALLLVALASATGEHGFLQGPYLACSGAVICFGLRLCLGRRGAFRPGIRLGLAGWFGAVIGATVAVPPWYQQQAPVAGPVAIIVACALLMAVHEFVLPRYGKIATRKIWTASRILLSCAAALAIGGLQGLNLIPPWPEPELSVIQSSFPF